MDYTVDYTFTIPAHLIEAVGQDFARLVIEKKTDEAVVLISKQADYGPNNIAKCPIGPVNGLIVRLYDKVARLANITRKNQDPQHEPLIDTALDIANYGTILSLVVERAWPNLDQEL